MDDYIRRQTAMDCLTGIFEDPVSLHEYIAVTLKKLQNAPSADVQPVRHGHWETIEGWDGDELYRCSECGDEFVLIEGTPNDNNYWFCPHCGADMRGEK